RKTKESGNEPEYWNHRPRAAHTCGRRADRVDRERHDRLVGVAGRDSADDWVGAYLPRVFLAGGEYVWGEEGRVKEISSWVSPCFSIESLRARRRHFEAEA